MFVRSMFRPCCSSRNLNNRLMACATPHLKHGLQAFLGKKVQEQRGRSCGLRCGRLPMQGIPTEAELKERAQAVEQAAQRMAYLRPGSGGILALSLARAAAALKVHLLAADMR